MADQTPGDPGAHGSDNAGGSKPFKVFATQEEFDAHAAGIRAAAERKAKPAVAPDQLAKLEALENELAAHKQRDLEAAGNYEQAKAALQKDAEAKVAKAKDQLDRATAALRHYLVDASLKSIAEAKGAYNPADVVAHLKDRIALGDDFGVRVYDAPGGAVQDGVSLDDAVLALLKDNPHLAKATGLGSGAGASGGKSVGQASGSPAAREAQAKYDAAKQKVAENPRDPAASAALLAAQQQLTLARAK